MTASAAIEHTFPVGRYRVTLTLPASVTPGQPVAIACEWSPTLPGRLSATELRQYRAGRALALQALAERTGLAVACLET